MIAGSWEFEGINAMVFWGKWGRRADGVTWNQARAKVAGFGACVG